MIISLTETGQVIPFKAWTFPDGQRHVELLEPPNGEYVTIETRIANAQELFDLLLVKDVLDVNLCRTALNIRYLLGARMDRRINSYQPHTLGVVAMVLRDAGFQKIRVLDPHSSVVTHRLGAEEVYPMDAVQWVLDQYRTDRTVVVAPDKGATERVSRFVNGRFEIVQGLKCRDANTGALSGFAVVQPEAVRGKACLIMDDICDGGSTFTGLSDVLLAAGALWVDLYVTHGIFSKGTPLHGIRRILTTDSYQCGVDHTIAFKVRMPR